MAENAAPIFCGVWRTDSAAIRFCADGTFETLHSPSSGTYQVLRDTEWQRRPVASKSGYILLMLFDSPPGVIRGGALHLIDEFAPDRAILRTQRVSNEDDVFTIVRDTATK